jgi:hypothetical protein
MMENNKVTCVRREIVLTSDDLVSLFASLMAKVLSGLALLTFWCSLLGEGIHFVL